MMFYLSLLSQWFSNFFVRGALIFQKKIAVHRKLRINIPDNNNYQYFILRKIHNPKLKFFLEVRILPFAVKTMIILRCIDKFT
jgi:hypothetical protein